MAVAPRFPKPLRTLQAPSPANTSASASPTGADDMGMPLPTPSDALLKTCKKCGGHKPATEFSKHAKRRDGLQPYCKECANEINAAWRTANPEKASATYAAWHEENSEKKKAANAAWRASNSETIRVINAAYRAANSEKINKVSAKWRAANIEAGRIYAHNRRARKREAGGRLSSGLAERLFKLQRGKCACGCKQPLGDDYHLDHRMPLALGGTNTDDNMQLLTAKCNLQKSAKHPVDFMQQRGFLL